MIGREARDLPDDDRALDAVAGFTIMNDWSARDLQRIEMAVGLGPSKGKDFATSLGPELVTFDELADCYHDGRLHLEMTATVNGRLLSRGNSGSMYWTWPRLLAHASRDTTLRPGDVLGSGTVGSGCILELTPEAAGGWLKPGDSSSWRSSGWEPCATTSSAVPDRDAKPGPGVVACPPIFDSARSRPSDIPSIPMNQDSRAKGSIMKKSSGSPASLARTASSITCGRRREWSVWSRRGRSRPISAIN